MNIIMCGDNVAATRRGSVSGAGLRRTVACVLRSSGAVTCGAAAPCVRARVRAAFHRGGPSPPLADPA